MVIQKNVTTKTERLMDSESKLFPTEIDLEAIKRMGIGMGKVSSLLMGINLLENTRMARQ